ncbi:MAG: MFS transporter [Planctomycetota bacterium]
MSRHPARRQADAHSILGDNAHYVRRNHLLGVTAGAFAGVSRNFIHPELILGGLMYAVTGSAYAVALIPVLNKLGGLTPQLAVSTFLEHSPRRRPYFIALTVARTLAHFGVVAGMWVLTQRDDAAGLTIFFSMYMLLCITNGTGHVIFMDMVGRLIPPTRVGGFLGTRRMLGGGLGIAASFLVIQRFTGKGAAPENYLVLALIGAILAGIDMSIWCHCRECDGAKAEHRTNIGDSLRRGFNWLKHDHNYRCYLGQRVAFRFNYLLLVFFIPFGEEQLRPEGGTASLAVLGGIMVGTMGTSRVISAAIWGRVADRYGSRMTMIAAGSCLVLTPLMALGTPHLPTALKIPVPATALALGLPLLVYLAALALLGAGLQGTFLGGQRFLITNAPAERRASYLAFLNTLTSPLTLLPLAGAFLVDTLGASTLFVVTTVSGALAVLSAWLMRPETPHPSEADRNAEGDKDGKQERQAA